jgi:hypothetical protein
VATFGDSQNTPVAPRGRAQQNELIDTSQLMPICTEISHWSLSRPVSDIKAFLGRCGFLAIRKNSLLGQSSTLAT